MVVVAVPVEPGAWRTRVGGTYDGPHGRALVVAVTAPDGDGARPAERLRAPRGDAP